jgi:hypothetical protein
MRSSDEPESFGVIAGQQKRLAFDLRDHGGEFFGGPGLKW